MLQIVVNKSNLILSIDLKSKSNHTDMGRSSKVPYTKDDLPQRIQFTISAGTYEVTVVNDKMKVQTSKILS